MFTEEEKRNIKYYYKFEDSKANKFIRFIILCTPLLLLFIILFSYQRCCC